MDELENSSYEVRGGTTGGDDPRHVLLLPAVRQPGGDRRVPLGSTLTCWSCGFQFVLARGVESRAATGQGRGEGKGEDRRHARDVQKKATPAEEDHWAQEAAGGMPPLGLFFAGTFRFPFYLATLSESLRLSIGAVVLVAGIRLALWCYHTDDEQLDPSTRVLLWNGLMLSAAFGGVFALVWACAAAACGLTVLHDTSHGADAIESWPNLLRLEGPGELVYTLSAVVLSALPGLLSTSLWRWLGVPRPLGIAVTVPVLFPIFLLSMLETRSPTDPVSLAVWRSVLYAWRAWLAFYLIALATAVVTAALMAAALCWPAGRSGWWRRAFCRPWPG